MLTSYAQNLQKFVTFKELYEKPAVLKTAAEAFKTLFKRFYAQFLKVLRFLRLIF